MYDKNQAALTPPMGWNSYDYYNTTVNEEQVKANADFMAEKLRKFGWEYIVVDIQWSDPDAGSTCPEIQYTPFARLCVDEYSRQIPDPVRFPSSAGGKGFESLASYCHQKGLKFGIHIMRGIPKQCCHLHSKIYGTDVTADKIANPFSVCKWNGDMYGVDYTKKGAQEYYNSVFQLYAQWGVDFVKVDDICNTNLYEKNPYSAEKEIEMIAKAISLCGRKMVLSLSPGPAVIEKAWHLEKYANMWRITDDFWDNWKLLKNMFNRCEVWQKHVGDGCWPDCDMIPLNKLAYGWSGKPRLTEFTRTEEKTMFTLWSIFRSPLMLGTDLPQLDEESLALITNEEVLALNSHSRNPFLVSSDENQVVWVSYGEGCPAKGMNFYVALFNISDEKREVTVRLSEIQGISESAVYKVRDLWQKKDLFPLSGNAELSETIEAHGCVLLKLS